MSVFKNNRVLLPFFGLLAGLAFYFLFAEAPQTDISPRLILTAFAFCLPFFSSLLLLTGPVSLTRALFFALVVALIAGGLYTWASFRFELGGRRSSYLFHRSFLEYLILCAAPLPFIVSKDRTGSWFDYEELFDQAWVFFVRGSIALLLASCFMMLLFLSGQFLATVEFDYLNTILRRGWFTHTVFGAVFGFALAILFESERVLSTLKRVKIQFLRILVPLVSTVVLIFLFSFFFLESSTKAWGPFFGKSPTTSMIFMGLFSIILVAAVVDANEAEASRSKILVVATRVLAALVAALGGLSVHALYLRVSEYGWTPDRVGGVIIASVVLAYSLGYCFVMLVKPRGWNEGIRTTNIVGALGVIFVSALSLTPLLNSVGISANSQVDRFIAGKVDVKDLDLYVLKKSWGRSGLKAVERLEALEEHPQLAELKEELKKKPKKQNGFQIQNERRLKSLEQERPNLARQIEEKIGVYPNEGKFIDFDLSTIETYNLERFRDGCNRTVKGLPQCALVVADLNPNADGDEAVAFWLAGRAVHSRLVYNKAELDLKFNNETSEMIVLPQIHGTNLSTNFIGGIGEEKAADFFAYLNDQPFLIEDVNLRVLKIDDKFFTPIYKE